MFGDKLLKLRKKQGLSQQQVADLLGVSRQTISNWELDQGAPALDAAAQLAEVYQISLDDLASDEVGVVTSGRGAGASKPRVLQWLVGKTVKLEYGVDSEWFVAPAVGTAVRVLDVDANWMRIEYERTKPSTLRQKETVVQLVDVDDICGAVVVEDKNAAANAVAEGAN